MTRANDIKLATNSPRKNILKPSENCDFRTVPTHGNARQESSSELPTRLGRLGRTRQSLTACITPDAALNLNVHILLHVSPEQHERVKRNMRGWMKRCGATPIGSVWRTRIINGVVRNKGANVVDPVLYLKNLSALRNYILKHCHPKVAKALGFTSAGPCELSGKRVSVSQNLSPKRRAACQGCNALKVARP